MIFDVLERKLLFKPKPSGDATPADLGLGYDETWAETGREQLHCWFIPGSHRPDLTFMWFGGIAGNMGLRVGEFAAVRAHTGAGIFAFDYSGFGRSAGKASVEQTAQDALVAWYYFQHHYRQEPEQIALFGVSMGAAVAVRLATEVNFSPAGMVLVSPFASLRNMARLYHPWLTLGGRLVGDRYNSVGLIDRINCPLLIARGGRDDVIPPSQGYRLWEAAQSPKHLLTIGDAGHEDIGECPEFWDTLENWTIMLQVLNRS